MHIDFSAETLIFMRHPESLLNRLSDLAKQGDTDWLLLFKAFTAIPKVKKDLSYFVGETDIGKLDFEAIDNRLMPITTSKYFKSHLPATTNGEMQAKKTGEWLKTHYPKCDHVYDSGFERVKQGLHIMEYFNSVTDERLAEYDHGDWEFLSQTERLKMAQVNKIYSRYITDPYRFTPPNGHSFEYDEKELVAPFLRDLANMDAKIILCGTHGIKLQLIRKLFEHQTEEEFLRDNNDRAKRFENCELLIYTRRSPRTQHLYPDIRYVRRVLPWKMESTTHWKKIFT
jgi:broad specificity phosphatase PhoE